MSLDKDFINNHLFQLRDDYGKFELDVRMCQLGSLDYAFKWEAYLDQTSNDDERLVLVA